MDQREQAGTAVAVAAAGEMMLLKQAGPDRTAAMAARMLEAESIKSALAAVGRVKLAEPELLAARQVKAEMDSPAVSVALQPTMLEGAAVLSQSMEAMEMVVLGVAVAEMHRALQILAVAVVAAVFRVIRAV